MSNADIEVLPGYNRADLTYLAECLEGVHGEGRVAESAPKAAAFIRAVLATAEPGADAMVTLSDAERRLIAKQRAHAERNAGDPVEPE